MTGRHALDSEPTDPDIAVEPPEQYVPEVEVHEPSGEGPAQWQEPDAS